MYANNKIKCIPTHIRILCNTQQLCEGLLSY